ncbi:protein LTV1 homolog [Maniola hyperantus]|uniref:protein LTV1 homolog n=1 Tax=Aphantopus hyperantus TaxID=2795564 RepID=UPI00156917F3|nr:protein LTV1 homolog [Maniola hyperantus]
MPKAKKKFIDRKKAVTFNLVHRSQRDPLVADESAPQRVLVPVNANIPARKEKEPELTPEQRREEQMKYGVYFDDDYNYLQHLKDTREVTLVLQPKSSHKRKQKPVSQSQDSGDEDIKEGTETLQLPSSVFASEVEENVGLLNKAASQGLCLDLDPDVVAALDEDFDFDDPDNQLDDNFIEMAMAEGGSDEEDYSDSDQDSMSGDDSDKAFVSDDDDGSDMSQEGRHKMPSWGDKDETKSRFSQYSMSSSVIRRNQGLSLLDNRFEKMFEEYDDTEVGALDLEEIEGFLPESHKRLLEAAEQFEESQRRYQLDKEKEIARMERLQEIQEESEEDDLVTVEVDNKEKWDCETILSTYSNLYNHPKIIEEPRKPQKIKINPKTGIPEDILGTQNKLTLKSLAKFNAEQKSHSNDVSDDDGVTDADTVLSTLSVLSIRPKEETPEEKKERKRLLKEYRKERRVEKKANKEAFRDEKKRQEKIMMNNRNNVQGNKIL